SSNICIYAVEPSEKSVEIMRKFSEQYARKSETYFCMDKGVTSVVIKVVLKNCNNVVNCHRVLLIIKLCWEHHCVHVGK
ncbi:hypothetical protein BHM03_00062955, partial [Ensete ventricosum]